MATCGTRWVVRILHGARAGILHATRILLQAAAYIAKHAAGLQSLQWVVN